MTDIKTEIIEKEKYFWFVKHLEEHFEMAADKKITPSCPLCNKDIDVIAKETYREILKKLKEVQQ